jgi:hypothetical protein
VREARGDFFREAIDAMHLIEHASLDRVLGHHGEQHAVDMYLEPPAAAQVERRRTRLVLADRSTQMSTHA